MSISRVVYRTGSGQTTKSSKFDLTKSEDRAGFLKLVNNASPAKLKDIFFVQPRASSKRQVNVKVLKSVFKSQNNPFIRHVLKKLVDADTAINGHSGEGAIVKAAFKNRSVFKAFKAWISNAKDDQSYEDFIDGGDHDGLAAELGAHVEKIFDVLSGATSIGSISDSDRDTSLSTD